MEAIAGAGFSGVYEFTTLRSIAKMEEMGLSVDGLPKVDMVVSRWGHSVLGRVAEFVCRKVPFLRGFNTRIIPGVEAERSVEKNLIPTEGLNFVLNVLSQSGTSKINTWYMGIGTGNYTVAATDTAANIVGVGRANETSLYDEAARPALVLPASTTGVLTNTASKATFTANNTVTVTNAFVVSTSPKADVSGTLLSSLKLGTSKALVAADQLVVTFTLTATSV